MEFYSDSNKTNSSSTLPSWSGFIFLFGSSFFYGSNYLPVKQYETGDGMFFQLILCIAIWTVGFVINCARNFPKFYPLPILGGFLWATGNANTVLIIKTIGLGLGMLFWNAIGLITGWATARFGWFGLEAEIPSNKVLNYIGVVMALFSTIFYLFVKSETKSSDVIPTSSSTEALADSEIPTIQSETSLINSQDKRDFIERMDPKKKRILGIILSVISGVMYGQSNTPILYTSEQSKESSNYLDYMFSYYTGILLTSLAYFVIYCIAKKNKPDIYPQVILPGLISGWMWGIANLCYFLATNALSQAISFPISNSGPPIVASLWGIFLYKEIRGKRNFLFLLMGFTVAITGSIITGLSF